MFNFKTLTVASLVVILTVSCSKDEQSLISPDSVGVNLLSGESSTLIPSTLVAGDLHKNARIGLTNEVKKSEGYYEEVAQLVAASMDDKSFRAFLKAEANKKFDGDYDILFSNVKNAKVDDKNLTELIASKSKKASPAVALQRLQQIAQEDPLLNLSIPVNIKKWDAQKYKLLVAASPVVEGAASVKAFDSDGKVYYLNGATDPDQPVVVVGYNERTVSFAKEKALQGKAKGARVSGYQEKVTYLKCPDLSAIESWYFAGPEIRFTGAVWNNDRTSATEAFDVTKHPSRDQASDGYFFTQELFNWYYDDFHGPDYYTSVIEVDDSGTTHKFTVGVTIGKKDATSGTASYEITYKAQDRKIFGRTTVYRDPAPRQLSDDYIIFNLENAQ